MCQAVGRLRAQPADHDRTNERDGDSAATWRKANVNDRFGARLWSRREQGSRRQQCLASQHAIRRIPDLQRERTSAVRCCAIGIGARHMEQLERTQRV